MASDAMPEVTLDSSQLDETVADPLMAIEREVLTKLREHDVAVSALRDDIAGLQQRSASGAASMAELRRLVKEADRVEGLLDSSTEVLSRSNIIEAGWPAPDLAQARAVLGAVDACEAATSAARDQIRAEDTTADGESPGVLCNSLQNLLETWARLQSTEAEMRRTDLPASKVDLMMEGRRNAISPLCAALMDKVEGTYASLKSSAGDKASESASIVRKFIEKLQKDDVSRCALQSLEVEIPVLDETPTQRLMSVVDEDAISPTRTAGDVAAAAQAAVDAAVKAMNTQADESSPTTTPQRLSSPFAIGSAEVDTIAKTVPTATVGRASASGSVPASSSQRYIVPSGSAELWHAVHVGDEAAVRHYMNAGACDGTLRDASGHSVLWHCIAFNHIALANLMFDTYPPGSEKGVEVSETHQRKGDTMLHILCSSKSFSAETATLFKKIAVSAPEEIFLRVNQAGVTFFQIAAAQLNFWVLTFVLKNFQASAMALVCMVDHAPLRNMAEALPQPTPPEFSQPAAFPDHFHVADMLQPDESGVVPYADVAFDVGPDSGGSATGRFLAHRIIVASESPVLMQELSKLPMTLLPREQIQAAVFRVDPRISKEVWRSILQFMYTGVINITFNNDVHKVVELLRSCVAYQLPKPLLDYAQSCLYPLLPNHNPEVALQVFSICAGAASSDVDLSAAREGSTYILLRSAHKLFEETDVKEACQILEKVVQSVEQGIFRPKPSSVQQQPRGEEIPAALDGTMNQTAGMPQPMQMAQGKQIPQTAGMDMMAQSLSSAQGMSPYMYAASPDMMKQTMRGPPDMMQQTLQSTNSMMQTMNGSPEMMMAMHGSPDMLSQSRRMPPDMMSQSPDMMSQSRRMMMPQAADMMSQSRRAPLDMLSQTGQGTSDMMMQTRHGSPEMMQTMIGSPEMMQTMLGSPEMMQTMQGSPEMMQTMHSSPDMMSQSRRMMPTMHGTPEMMQSMHGSPDMAPQSRRVTPEMMQAMRGAPDMMQTTNGSSDAMSQSRRMTPEDFVSKMQDPRMQMMQDPRLQMMQDQRLQMMQNSGQGYPQLDMSYSQGMPQQHMQNQMYSQASIQAMAQQGIQPGQHMTGQMQGGMMARYA